MIPWFLFNSLNFEKVSRKEKVMSSYVTVLSHHPSSHGLICHKHKHVNLSTHSFVNELALNAYAYNQPNKSNITQDAF